mgnify:CR=1 FL=1
MTITEQIKEELLKRTNAQKEKENLYETVGLK